MNGNVDGRRAYLPFRGLSAWFSSSVKPALSRKWDHFGGIFAEETEADYLFSDNAFSADTMRVYNAQLGVTVFQSAWVSEIINQRCTVHDVSLGRYLLLPHYLVQTCVSEDPFTTPDVSTVMEERSREDSHAPASLSQLLAKWEEAKARRKGGGGGGGGGKGGGGIGRYGRLKNSRKLFSPHLEKGDPPTSGDTKLDKVQVSDGVPPVSTDSGAALTSSARHRNKTVLCTEQPDTLWEQLMLTMKTVNMEDMVHIDDVNIQDLVLTDFNPHIPEFTMKRKSTSAS